MPATPSSPGRETGVGSWQVHRPARALKDPVSGETLAYEAFHLGAAQVTADGSPATCA